jgi:hypothetical protein
MRNEECPKRPEEGRGHRRCLASRFEKPLFGFKNATLRIGVPGTLSGRAMKGKRVGVSAAGGPQLPLSENGFNR